MKAVYEIYKDTKGRAAIKCRMYTEQGNCFKGVATCSPEDTFNADYGMELALARAKEKQLLKIRENRDKAWDDAIRERDRAEVAWKKADRQLMKHWDKYGDVL